MKENEPRPIEGNAEELCDFGELHAALKFAIAVRIAAVLFILLISCSIHAAVSAGGPDSTQPSTLEVWPAGTRLLIPDRVMESYRKKASSWSHPSVYHFANYYFTGPSFRDKRKETGFLPFVKERAWKTEQKEVWMDIMNISRTRDSDIVFITIGALRIVDMRANGKDLHIGVNIDN